MACSASPPHGQGHACEPQVPTETLAPTDAVVAAAAEHVRQHRHPVARPQAGHPVPDLGDLRGELVPDHLRQVLGRRVERPMGVLMQVGAADPAPLRLDAHLAGPHSIRLRHLLDTQIPVPVEPRR